MTEKNSSLSSASRVKSASGSETSGLKQIDSSPLISPSWIASMISSADSPLPGISDSAQPHTSATAARCSGLAMSRSPGSWSHFWPCSRPPWPLPCPVIVETPQPGLPILPVASPRLMAASTLSTPLVWCSMPAGVQQHPGARRCPTSSAACSIRAAGTPQTAAAQAGVMSATAAAASSKPTVCASMKSWSSQSWRISSCSMAPNSAESVPGRTGRNRSAVRAIGHDAGIQHDEPGAAVARPPDVAGGDGERLGDVRAGHPDDVGERDVAPRVRGPVDAERLLVADAGRHHAEPAVVVEVGACRRARRANLPTR